MILVFNCRQQLKTEPIELPLINGFFRLLGVGGLE